MRTGAAVLQRKMAGPIERLIELRLREGLKPTELRITNESHLHRHHTAMKGVESTETHFRVAIVSDEFCGKRLIARHRAVNKLLAAQLADGSIHALALNTKTAAEAAAAKDEVVV
ncbi:BolA domain UV induced protein Uvi31 [Coemansia spiralis]|nr:BolA domain UV induced protein Uvi31 [Coemansia spiralis]